LRPRFHPPLGPAPLRRPAHAYARGLDAGAGGGRAGLGGTGPDERRAWPARHHPAAAQRRGTPFRRRGGPDLMLSLVQRVREARVVVDGAPIGAIGVGLLVLVCAERGDSEAQADRLLAKLLKLRIFSDEVGKMNRSVQDVGG